MRIKRTIQAQTVREHLNAAERAIEADDWALAMRFSMEASKSAAQLFEYAKHKVMEESDGIQMLMIVRLKLRNYWLRLVVLRYQLSGAIQEWRISRLERRINEP